MTMFDVKGIVKTGNQEEFAKLVEFLFSSVQRFRFHKMSSHSNWASFLYKGHFVRLYRNDSYAPTCYYGVYINKSKLTNERFPFSIIEQSNPKYFSPFGDVYSNSVGVFVDGRKQEQTIQFIEEIVSALS